MRERELEKRVSRAVEAARRAGAQTAWASATWQRSVRFQVRDGKLEEATDSTSRGLQVRLLVNGRYSEHSTTDLRDQEVERFIADAVAMTRALQPDTYRRLPEPALFANLLRSTDRLEIFDSALNKLDRDRRTAFCQDMNRVVAGQKGIISATSTFTDDRRFVAAAGSNGFVGSYRATSTTASTDVTLEDGQRRPEEGMYAATRYVDDLPPPRSIAERALARTRARLGARKGKTQRATMIVDRRAAGSLIWRLLQPTFGYYIQQERSFWRGRLADQAVSNQLTITDDPLLPRGLRSRPFDSEGIAARQLPVIESGALRTYYLDTYYAKKMASEPTTGDPSNWLVTPGQSSRDQLLARAKQGVYVTSWLGGNMDTTTGDFSFGLRGHIIADGQLGAPIDEMNITGNMVDLFSHLVAVGNDPWQYSSIRVPTMVFEGVQFSGD